MDRWTEYELFELGSVTKAADALDLSSAVPATPALESNDGYLLRTAALQGQGILAQPTYVIHDDIVAGRLVPIVKEFQHLG